MSEHKKISVIIPCFNEGKYIAALLENLLSQDYPKDCVEIIFADGNSTDNTREIIRSYQVEYAFIQCVSNPRRFVSFGLNAAIAISTGDIIIRMDAHSIYPSNYWQVLVAKLAEHNADNVGGVWITQPGADTSKAKAIVLATTHPVGIGNAGYRLGVQADSIVDTVPYGCFHKEIFERIGNFDEEMLRNQDDEFNGRIIKNGGKIVLIPTVHILYYARENFSKLWKMFYQYGLFKPLVSLKLGAPATLRQFAPPLFIASLLVVFLFSVFVTQSIALFIAYIAFYATVLAIVANVIGWTGGVKIIFYTWISFPIIHCAYGLGYLAGFIRFVIFKKHPQPMSQELKQNR